MPRTSGEVGRSALSGENSASAAIAAIWKPFRDKEAALKGAPGKALTDMPEDVDGIEFVRYEHGVIIKRPDGQCLRVFGAINDRYQQLGATKSWLGLPVTDEHALGDEQGGQVNVFDNGQIYHWPDVGAIDLNNVVARYTGLSCHETSSGPGSDEPYVVFSVTTPPLPGQAEVQVHPCRSQIYDEVDSGDWRSDSLELYRGKPRGMVIRMLLMDNDEGDPDKYTSEFQAATKAGAGALSGAAAAAVPVLAPYIAAASPLIMKAADEIGKAISGAFGTGDDDMGTKDMPLTAKELVLLATRTPRGPGTIVWKREVGRFDGDGANYSVFLDFEAV